MRSNYVCLKIWVMVVEKARARGVGFQELGRSPTSCVALGNSLDHSASQSRNVKWRIWLWSMISAAESSNQRLLRGSCIYFIPIRKAIIKKEKRKHQVLVRMWRNCWWACKMVEPLWKTVWWFLKNLNQELHEPAVPLLGMYSKELKAKNWRDVCTPMFTAALFTIAKK